MSLINGLLALLGEIESDAIAVHEERCISVRNRNADCLRCVEACTSGALAYRAGGRLVGPGRCIGCGAGATACPTCAIELRNPTEAELTAQLKHSIVATKGHPVIVCEQALEAANVAADDASAACAVPCPGRMDESALVGLAAYRAFDATLACGSCETCPHAPGGALVREVVEGARRACCHEFVEGLPEGYATRLGEGGATLSGGERQRLSIARAILKDAPIVILDEATANVDPENERDLQRAIAGLTRSKTVIMIAHRLKTVRDADQIVVLDGGRIVQRGTHDALMAEGGLYADFVGMRERAIGWKLGGAATCANAPA